MAEGDLAKVRGLTILAERIPPNIKDELITELAKDDQLNPKSVPVEGIRERLYYYRSSTSFRCCWDNKIKSSFTISQQHRHGYCERLVARKA